MYHLQNFPSTDFMCNKECHASTYGFSSWIEGKIKQIDSGVQVFNKNNNEN